MERIIVLTIWRMLDRVRGWQRGTYTIEERHTAPQITITGVNAARKHWLETDLIPNLGSGLRATMAHGKCELTLQEEMTP